MKHVGVCARCGLRVVAIRDHRYHLDLWGLPIIVWPGDPVVDHSPVVR